MASKRQPSGEKHRTCVLHVPHSYPKSGWLCITDPHADVAERVEWADYLAELVAARHRAFQPEPVRRAAPATVPQSRFAYRDTERSMAVAS